MTTTTHPETQITADPDLPLIHIVREFEAPVEAVFRAHTDPELVQQWLGPRRLTMRIERWDAQTGGAYRYVHSGEDGTEHGFYGSFHEIRSPERLVQTFTYEGFPDGVCLETLTLEDLGGRTRLHGTSVFFSKEGRDMMISSGMESGVVEGYEQLDELLAST
ncbi:MAG: SRPBCC family protein [Pseudonocardiaceae bacterium]